MKIVILPFDAIGPQVTIEVDWPCVPRKGDLLSLARSPFTYEVKSVRWTFDGEPHLTVRRSDSY